MIANINLKVGDEVGVNEEYLATVKGFKADTDGTVLVTVVDQDDEAFDVKIGNLNKNDYEDYKPLIVESKIGKAIEGINYKLLREQKLALLKIISAMESEEYSDYMIGLLHFIDAIQDAIVEDGIRTEKQVFGTLK